MKKVIPLLFLLSLLLVLLVSIHLKLVQKLPEDGKFGFLRNAENLNLEGLEDTGATWFRPNFGYFVWGSMQKDSDSPIDFTKTDEVVRDAEKRGLRLLITVFPFADWDQKNKGLGCKVTDNDTGLPERKGDFETPGLPYYRCNPNNWGLYEKWLVAVVDRYDGDGKNDMSGLQFPVLHYEIGNEPDLMKDAVSGVGTVYFIGTPAEYAELLQKSYTAIKSENSKVQVLVAAPAGVQHSFADFWDKVFAIPDIGDFFDIGNMHCLSAPSEDSNDPVALSAEDLNVTFYKKLLTSHDIVKPIWVTEAENVQGSNVQENVQRLKESVSNALKNGAQKIFFTGASFANDPMRYTSEILLEERSYYKDIIYSYK
ncbi:MAG: hypothetical protein ACD_22C00099G0001 [uncultured bacterium]|nr:MAG: hypothetical protein ACD_22C00099G0001 [uncultured bacterium]